MGARFCPFDGTALDHPGRPQRDPLIGAVIGGRYRLGSRIGTGGFAVVYLAHHIGLGMDVALKVLQAMPSEKAIARFAREARTASRIAHENVVSVFDFGWAEQGFHYLVMEHVPGTPLDAEISRAAPFPAARAAHILAQIAAGVGRAHEMGIVHRDLKPENVILGNRGSDRDFVKVLDFGLAKMVRPDASTPAITVAGEVFGTPEYMAPEQWRAAEADRRTDVYAMGLIAHEMLTGKRPFDGSLADLMRAHLEASPGRLRDLVPGTQVPESFEDLVMVCLRKDPAHRFQDVDALLRALGRVWQSVPCQRGRTTYATTNAAPPRPSPDSIPDPTVYQSQQIDVVWDGPTLCAEIRRLHELRLRRLGELADPLWSGKPPPPVAELGKPIVALEGEVDAAGKEIAAVEARLEELRRNAREREAELRGESSTPARI